MDDNLCLKGARSRHVMHFKFQGPKHNSGITEAVPKERGDYDRLLRVDTAGEHRSSRWNTH